MGTKNNPAPFDCYANAEPDEPMFVLLARDQSAPGLVREWVRWRAERKGLRHHDAKAIEALACARAMEEWRIQQALPIRLAAPQGEGNTDE